MSEMMISTNEADAGDAEAVRRREIEALRRSNNLLCLWRVCANAACRRARCCRGRAHLCPRRNEGLVPKPVREFFLSCLAAHYVGLGFEEFKAEMEGRDETEAFFAWRKACAAPRTR